MDMDIPELVEELPPDFTTKPEYLATVSDTAAFEAKDVPQRKIPITIVTGYLGSGKLTLLEAIGRTSNKRLAIILNEFGDTAAIEKAVTIQDQSTAVQEWLDLGNGCLCCTVKDNGVLAIENLVALSGDRIDHILLETTGVADPAPIARMFWLDDALASCVYIDGVVTVVDACNIAACLSDVGGHWHRSNNHLLRDAEPAAVEKEAQRLAEGLTTAHLQIALADVVLLNKIDKVDDAEAAQLEQRIRGINGPAPIHRTSYGDIALDKILDLHAFEASEKMVQLVTLSHDMLFHDDRIATVALDFPFFQDAQGFAQAELFLQSMLWENSTVEVHRVKGILVCGDDVRVIQGVRDTYDIIENGTLPEGISSNKIVFIGKGLVKADLEAQLAGYL